MATIARKSKGLPTHRSSSKPKGAVIPKARVSATGSIRKPGVEDDYFTDEELMQIHRDLLNWYDRNHRVLPWRRTLFSKKEASASASSASAEKAPPKGAGRRAAPAHKGGDPDLDLDPEDGGGAAAPASDALPLDQFAYHVWVSEVMLQQTQVATVIPYFLKWVRRWPTVEALAAADQHQVNAMWAGLGYYRRARQLLDGSQFVVKHMGGRLPEAAKDLLKIPGIGPYTSAAISSIVFGRAAAAVDGNVIRVVSRLRTLAGDPTKLSHVHAAMADQMLDTSRPGDFNQAVMELGATVCRPLNPLCDACPLAPSCRALAAARSYVSSGGDPRAADAPSVTAFPSKKAVKEKKEQRVAVVLLNVIIRRRRMKRSGEGTQGAREAAACPFPDDKDGDRDRAGQANGSMTKKEDPNPRTKVRATTARQQVLEKRGAAAGGSAGASPGGVLPSAKRQRTLMDCVAFRGAAAKSGKQGAKAKEDDGGLKTEAVDAQIGQESGGSMLVDGEDLGKCDEASLLLLTRRPLKGLLAGFWEFPGFVFDEKDKEEEKSYAQRQQVADQLIRALLPPPLLELGGRPWYVGGWPAQLTPKKKMVVEVASKEPRNLSPIKTTVYASSLNQADADRLGSTAQQLRIQDLPFPARVPTNAYATAAANKISGRVNGSASAIGDGANSEESPGRGQEEKKAPAVKGQGREVEARGGRQRRSLRQQTLGAAMFMAVHKPSSGKGDEASKAMEEVVEGEDGGQRPCGSNNNNIVKDEVVADGDQVVVDLVVLSECGKSEAEEKEEAYGSELAAKLVTPSVQDDEEDPTDQDPAAAAPTTRTKPEPVHYPTVDDLVSGNLRCVEPPPPRPLLSVVRRSDAGSYVHVFSHIRQTNYIELVTVELDVDALCAAETQGPHHGGAAAVDLDLQDVVAKFAAMTGACLAVTGRPNMTSPKDRQEEIPRPPPHTISISSSVDASVVAGVTSAASSAFIAPSSSRAVPPEAAGLPDLEDLGRRGDRGERRTRSQTAANAKTTQQDTTGDLDGTSAQEGGKNERRGASPKSRTSTTTVRAAPRRISIAAGEEEGSSVSVCSTSTSSLDISDSDSESSDDGTSGQGGNRNKGRGAAKADALTSSSNTKRSNGGNAVSSRSYIAAGPSGDLTADVTAGGTLQWVLTDHILDGELQTALSSGVKRMFQLALERD